MNENRDVAIQINGLKKRYRLGVIGGGTLQGDIQSWWAKKRGKEDPNLKIGQQEHGKNETFMALDGIDLTVYKGERLGIIGHNGAGKSTLLKLLSRVTAPTEGRICIDGRISSMLEVGTGFNPELTGRENIYLNGAILGMSRAEVDSKIDQIIEFSECGQFIDTPVKRYSSGMYVKLAFSVAAHLDSEILVMDEVLAVGDMKFQQKCLGKMSDVSQSEGRTVLYVSHNMNTIRQLCNRCVVLDHGKVVFDGDVEKAIDIYLEQGQREGVVSADLSKVERDKPELGKMAKLCYFEFINKDEPVFNRGEKIIFRLKIQKFQEAYNFKVLLPIKYLDSEIVGSCLSCNLNQEDAIYEMDLSQLIAGRYSFAIALYAINEYGTETMCDHSIIKFSIDIQEEKNAGIDWKRQWWGSIKFPEIKEYSGESC
jgi:lipopolysaccharide transport system ATP-binding protein